MKTFLQRIVQGRVPSNALDNCTVTVIEEDSVDTIEYSYDEDDYIDSDTDSERTTNVYEVTEVNTELYIISETNQNSESVLQVRENNSTSAPFV